MISVENHNGDLVNKVFFKSEEERDKKYKELKEFKAKKKYGKLISTFRLNRNAGEKAKTCLKYLNKG